MRKGTLYFLIVILYLLTPISILAMLGTMVSKKFEVDESYWVVYGSNTLTLEQKRKRINHLDIKGRQMELNSFVFGAIAVTALSVGTGLLFKRKSILFRRKAVDKFV